MLTKEQVTRGMYLGKKEVSEAMRRGGYQDPDFLSAFFEGLAPINSNFIYKVWYTNENTGKEEMARVYLKFDNDNGNFYGEY